MMPEYIKINLINSILDCYTPDMNISTKAVIKKIAGRAKKQIPNIVLNLDDYAGNIDELIDLVKRKFKRVRRIEND